MIRETLPFTVHEPTAEVDFSGNDHPERYDLLLTATSRAALQEPSVYRVEVLVACGDAPRRRALHRAGFRLDGILRGRITGPEGPTDAACYSLLRTDRVAGADGFTAVMNTVTARKRAIAHLLLTDQDGRVCVLETSFKPDFELPGGILETGESPRVGLTRECVEELGHPLSASRLLVVDWLAPYLGWEDAIELIFDGGTLADHSRGVLRPDLREIRAVHWLEPAPAAEKMAPFARGRLAAALAARELGRTLYLEAGRRIS